MGQPLAFL